MMFTVKAPAWKLAKLAAAPVATNAPEAEAVAEPVATKHGKYKDPEDRKAKMRDYMRNRRAGLTTQKQGA